MDSKISALVLAMNSADTLGRTLDSLKDLDEVIVVDGGSTDDTLDTAASCHNVKIHKNPFRGFSDQRNFGLEKVRHRWCLVVDSDERATPELVAELHRIAASDDAKPLYYVMRTEYFMGRAMERGYHQSLYLPRFFRKEGVSFKGLIHESPYLDGVKANINDRRFGKIAQDLRILHNPENSIRRALGKIGKYSLLKADERIARGEAISAPVILLSFVKTFLKVYIREARKGRRGFILTLLVCCHRCLANLVVYGEKVDGERSR